MLLDTGLFLIKPASLPHDARCGSAQVSGIRKLAIIFRKLALPSEMTVYLVSGYANN